MRTSKDRKISRCKVSTYNGFDIIKVEVSYFHRNIFLGEYDSSYIDKIVRYYSFCKEGENKKPSQEYDVRCDVSEEVKKCIDKFIEDDSLYFTNEEIEKYVHRPNRKCDWRYGYESLMCIMRQHKKADKRMKILLEDRLTDANFHAESGYLAEGKYKEFEELCAMVYKFPEIFTVKTLTMRKPLKMFNGIEKGIGNAINEYLKSVGIKDTEVCVSHEKID